MSDYISEELWVEILKRLPVSSIIKFRCVCKSWYSLISTSHFRSIHLAHSVKSDKRYLLLQMRSCNDSDKFFLFSNKRDDLSVKELDLSFIQGSRINIIGSCDGLICGLDINNHSLFLWNPVVSESLTILSGTHSFAVGFGFDYKKNDYKIVRVVYGLRSNCPGRKFFQPSSVEIYELSSGSWRSISVKDLPFFITNYFGLNTKNIGAYVNGVYHWLVECFLSEINQHGRATIATFSFCDETFNELVLPDALAKFAAGSLSLTVYSQSLAVIQYETHQNNVEPSFIFRSCSIWVMKEYGVVESWSKQFIFNLEIYGGLYVLGFRGNSEILFQTRDDEMVTRDYKTQEIALCGIRCSSIEVHPYTESLMLLKGAAESPNASRR